MYGEINKNKQCDGIHFFSFAESWIEKSNIKVRKTIQRSLILLLDILVFINCVRAQLIITSLVGIRIA